jgi:hypothetical protein
MLGHRGRPRSPRPPAGAAAVSGAQRVVVGSVVNVVALIAWAAETVDKIERTSHRR